jgi:hypothetical protein
LANDFVWPIKNGEKTHSNIIVYVGFVVINIELLEIIIDGLLVRIVFLLLGTTYDKDCFLGFGFSSCFCFLE